MTFSWNRSMLALSAALSLAAPSMVYAAQMIASLDMRRCFEQSKEGQEARAALEKLNDEISNKLQGLEKEIRELSSQLSNEEYRSNLAPTALEEMEKKLEKLFQEKESRHAEFSEQFNQTQMFISEGLINNLTKSAEMVAKAKGYDLILQKDTVIYGVESSDVTDLVIVEADKLFKEQSAKEMKK